MAKHQPKNRRKSGIKGMKLIAIKAECYALSGVATTKELKGKYTSLCRKRDFRKRKSWEYLLKNLRIHGDWMEIRVSDIEYLAEKTHDSTASDLGTLTFHLGRVEMDKAAENDD